MGCRKRRRLGMEPVNGLFSTWCIEIGGVELLGVENKNYNFDRHDWNTDLWFDF